MIASLVIPSKNTRPPLSYLSVATEERISLSVLKLSPIERINVLSDNEAVLA